jgi:hypothetical protein
MPSHPIPLRSILILFSDIRLGLPTFLLPSSTDLVGNIVSNSESLVVEVCLLRRYIGTTLVSFSVSRSLPTSRSIRHNIYSVSAQTFVLKSSLPNLLITVEFEPPQSEGYEEFYLPGENQCSPLKVNRHFGGYIAYFFKIEEYPKK